MQVGNIGMVLQCVHRIAW